MANALMDPRFRPFEPGPVNAESDASGLGGLYGPWYDWSQLPPEMVRSFYQPAVQNGDASTDPAVDETALRDWFSQTGNQLKSYNEGDTGYYNVFDPTGNALGPTLAFNGNDSHNQLAHYLTMAGIGGAGYAAASGAGAAGGAAGAGGWEVPLAESAQLPAEFGGFQGVGAAAGEAGAASSPLLPMGAEAGVGALPSVPAVSGTAASGGGWGSLASGLGDFFSGNGNPSDYARAVQTLAGLYTTNRATNAAQQGAEAQNALIREAMAKNQPLIDTRNNALGQINGLMADPSSITKDPGYQFGLNQGQRQIDNQAAARGGYYSGQQLKASQQFGQDYAGTKLDQTYNRLLGAAGLGQQGGASNTNLSLNLGQNAATQGNIRGSGYIGMGNTVNNGLGNWVNDWTNRKAWGEPG